ncbi:hypothetical protein CMI37_30930 [Candidatus Pacearchaeota archaeon]|nr:hypothetical protein [Candidatus Pacearchaeota archaeon]|tara:strand:- start:535 stop:813 length:279 start_codon:yes stop_codon:yes gene_type:complete
MATMLKLRRGKQFDPFRSKVALVLNDYVSRIEIMVFEDAELDVSADRLKEMKADPESRWNLEKVKARKELKKITAAIINRIHIKSYLDGYFG